MYCLGGAELRASFIMEIKSGKTSDTKLESASWRLTLHPQTVRSGNEFPSPATSGKAHLSAHKMPRHSL